MIVRIPDTSEKDKKIQAALTKGYGEETERSKARTRPSSSYRKKQFMVGTNLSRIYEGKEKTQNRFIPRHLLLSESIENPAPQAQVNEEENPRKYSALMDDHALHIFFVRNGKAIEETPEFESFKRVHSSIWGKVLRYISQIEIYCRILRTKMLKVNGSLLVKKVYRKITPTATNLIDCILPYEEQAKDEEPINFERKLELNAAIKIQSLFRKGLARVKARKLRIIYRKIKFIQGWIRTYLSKKNFKRKAIDNNNVQYLDFEKLQSRLKEDWEYMKEAGHVELHYNCLGGNELDKLSISKFEQKQNMQIGRIFRAAKRGVEIIYVSSTPVPDDVKRYYYKVLQLINVGNPQRKVHFLVPHKLEDFPPHISIASKILYSKDLIKSVRAIVNGRYCVIVGGTPSNDDIKLATYLQYPILSGNPLKNQVVMNQFQSKEVN